MDASDLLKHANSFSFHCGNDIVVLIDRIGSRDFWRAMIGRDMSVGEQTVTEIKGYLTHSSLVKKVPDGLKFIETEFAFKSVNEILDLLGIPFEPSRIGKIMDESEQMAISRDTFAKFKK